MARYQTVSGLEVPRAARKLARRDGVMRDWYDQSRDRMIATLLYSDGKLVGWCAAIRVKWWIFNTSAFEISTYVFPTMRKRGYAQRLLDRTLKTLKLVEPKGVIKYGTPCDHDYFNSVYEKVIAKNKLKPKRYFCV